MNFPRMIGIYLAAGKSRRMGRNKLNLPIGQNLLGSMAFQEALNSELDFILAVTRNGDSLNWLSPFSKSRHWGYVRCNEEGDGQSTSIKVGVMSAANLGADAILVLLGDQPFITSDGINKLIREFKCEPRLDFVASANNEILKPPILFGKTFFNELMSLTGDKGARAILKGKWKKSYLEFDNRYFKDIDTLEDYNSIQMGLEGSAWM